MTLGQLASAVGATMESGSADLEITGVAGLEQAVAGQVAFVANPKYAALAKTTAASAIIVDEKFPALATPLLRCKNPYLAFAKALELFYQPPRYVPGIHSTAVIDPSSKIGEGAHVGPYAVVEADVVIGTNA